MSEKEKIVVVECGSLVVVALILSATLVTQMIHYYLEQSSFTVLHIYITIGFTALLWIIWSLTKNVPWSDRVIVGHSLYLGGVISLVLAFIGGVIELSPGLSLSAQGSDLGGMTLLAMFIASGASVILGCSIRFRGNK